MKNLLLTKGIYPEALLRPTVNYILRNQWADGGIPWSDNNKLDPWDHIEAAMGLAIGGEYDAAKKAYQWLAQHQLKDGSWWAEYRQGQAPDESHRETHFIAYIAVGIWHFYRVTHDRQFLRDFFPVVEHAINFVLRYQADTGEIFWAVDEKGQPQEDALVTACSSIYKSLECAIAIAETLNFKADYWRQAYQKLGVAITRHPERFDRTWAPKTRFSMDWFYPVLTGVIRNKPAQLRLEQKWNEFVKNELGCLCVNDEPWVTVAESCELTLALLAAGEHTKAVMLFSWLFQFMDEDGGYWTGFNYRDQVIWPKEKTTWTCGAVLLAADALTEHTGACDLFLRSQIHTAFFSQQSLSAVLPLRQRPEE
jgi:hypothetical protein